MTETSKHPRHLSRRKFLLFSGSAAIASALMGCRRESSHRVTGPARSSRDSQRLPLSKLQEWESWKFGLFFHFGLSTFTGMMFDNRQADASVYAPDKLDVDSWVQIARDAGARYAVLTAKHVSGFCLWPSKETR